MPFDNKRWLAGASAALLACSYLTTPVRAEGLENLGRLKPIVELYRSNPAEAIQALRASLGMPELLLDSTRTQPVVAVYLDGSLPFTSVVQVLSERGFTVTATDSRYKKGIIEGYLPLERAEEIAGLAGVRSVLPQFRPVRFVGATTNQAVTVQNVAAVQNLGFSGTGIRIGALSDSYDAVQTAPTAADDVASGDLPGTGNPLGNTTPVTVFGTRTFGGSDEGRAMLQLMHDIAPKATLAFATATGGQTAFANNIRALRDQFGANIIVDDIIYTAEPMFEDGQVAQAVNGVAASGVAYFSSAGNNGNNGYLATYRPITRSQALTLFISGQENIRVTTVPQRLAQSYHDFDPGAGVNISQNFTVAAGAGATISFQWNEPFNTGAVATNYNLLVFNADGTFRAVLSGTDNNLVTDQPLELLTLPPGSYQLAIAKANTGPASVIRYVVVSANVSAEFFNGPTTYGHSVAAGGQSVGALFYLTPTQPESFTARGPSTIYFDTTGAPLPAPEVRQVPQISGVDGTNTTFFVPGVDAEGDGFPNFFGTSASAPNVAAVAALVLQAAGGPGRLTPAQIYSALQTTATDVPLDADPLFSKAVFSTFTLTATGNTGTDPNFFKASLSPVGSAALNRVLIDLTAAGLVFDPTNDATGFPFTLGTLVGVTPADVTATLTGDPSPTLQLDFAPGTFTAGDSVSFGIDRDLASINGSGNSADELQPARVSVFLSNGRVRTVKLANTFGPAGYDNVTGFGLVNALNAVNSVRP